MRKTLDPNTQTLQRKIDSPYDFLTVTINGKDEHFLLHDERIASIREKLYAMLYYAGKYDACRSKDELINWFKMYCHGSSKAVVDCVVASTRALTEQASRDSNSNDDDSLQGNGNVNINGNNTRFLPLSSLGDGDCMKRLWATNLAKGGKVAEEINLLSSAEGLEPPDAFEVMDVMECKDLLLKSLDGSEQFGSRVIAVKGLDGEILAVCYFTVNDFSDDLHPHEDLLDAFFDLVDYDENVTITVSSEDDCVATIRLHTSTPAQAEKPLSALIQILSAAHLHEIVIQSRDLYDIWDLHADKDALVHLVNAFSVVTFEGFSISWKQQQALANGKADRCFHRCKFDKLGEYFFDRDTHLEQSTWTFILGFPSLDSICKAAEDSTLGSANLIIKDGKISPQEGCALQKIKENFSCVEFINVHVKEHDDKAED